MKNNPSKKNRFFYYFRSRSELPTHKFPSVLWKLKMTLGITLICIRIAILKYQCFNFNINIVLTLIYIWDIRPQFDQDLAVMSQIFVIFTSNYLSKNTYPIFSRFFYFSFWRYFFSKKNHYFLQFKKIHKNLIKYIKVFGRY